MLYQPFQIMRAWVGNGKVRAMDMRTQSQQNGRIWVPLDAYEQLLEITQEELTSQMQRVLTEQSRDRDRRASRQQALLGTPQGDFVPPAREKLASPYPTQYHPKPSYRFAPTPDRPAYDMGRPPRRPPPQPALPPPPPLPTGPDPTSLDEEVDQLRPSREPDEDLVALAEVAALGQTRSAVSGRAGRLRLEAPSRLYTAALRTPEPRSCRLSPAVQLWSLSEAPPKPPASLSAWPALTLTTTQEERLLAMVEERLRRRPALHRRLQTAVLGTLDDGTMDWGRVWEDQLQA